MPIPSERVRGYKVSQGDKYARDRQPKACRCHFAICYSPSHWSFLSHFFSAFSDDARGRGDGEIALPRLTFYCLPCTDTNVCRRVYHPSLPGNKRNHAKYSVVCISRCFSLFPFCSHFNHAVSQTWGLWDFHCFHMKQTGGLFFIFYFLNVVVKRDCIVQKNNNNHNKKKACTCKSRHAHTP